MKLNYNARLCYVEHGKAFFTGDFDNATGDDWNDAPNEHNAGYPYAYDFYVHYDGNLHTPADIANGNSRYCVDDINSGVVPWLVSEWQSPVVAIPAGVTFRKFIQLVRRVEGGEVFIPYAWLEESEQL